MLLISPVYPKQLLRPLLDDSSDPGRFPTVIRILVHQHKNHIRGY